MFKLSQKGIAHVLLLILLLLGLVAGVYGVQYARTVLDPKASEENYIQIVDKDGNPMTKTTDPNVYLKISVPPGWFLPPELDKQVNTQNNCSDQAPYNGISCEHNPPTTEDECGDNYNWCDGGCCRYTGSNDQLPSSQAPKSNDIRLSILEIKDSLGSINPRIYATSGFGQYFNQLIPWKLDKNIFNKQQEVLMKLEGSAMGKSKSLFTSTSITLESPRIKEPSIPYVSPHIVKSPVKVSKTDEYFLDIYIDDQIADPSYVKQNMNLSVEEIINPALKKANISKHVNISKQEVVEAFGSCNDLWKEPILKLDFNKVAVFVTNEYGSSFSGWAQPGLNRICIPGKGNISAMILMHELGHIFGLPDYYFQDVTYKNNDVVKIGIFSKIRDIMWLRAGYFDPISAEVVNRSRWDTSRDVDMNARNFIPQKTSFKLVDEFNQAIPNVQVEIFPQVFSLTTDRFPMLKSVIPNVPAVKDITNKEGLISFGKSTDLFVHPKVSSVVPGESALLRLNNNGDIRFAAVTLSDLMVRYFELDDIQETTIPLIFSSLPTTPDSLNPINLRIGQTTQESELSDQQTEEIEQHILQELKVNRRINLPDNEN